jgi:hypothetical protein
VSMPAPQAFALVHLIYPHCKHERFWQEALGPWALRLVGWPVGILSTESKVDQFFRDPRHKLGLIRMHALQPMIIKFTSR